MLNQSFSKGNLSKLSWNTALNHNRQKSFDLFVSEQAAEIANKLKSENYVFDDLYKINVKGNEGFKFKSASDDIVIKKVNDNIKRLFKVKFSDRHSIVRQVIALAQDMQPFSLIRTDIKKFYENTCLSECSNQVIEQGRLSKQSRDILLSFVEKMNSIGCNNLPRGISISATLAEIALRKFDKEIRGIESIYYYARFVDDIIVFCIGDPSKVLSEMKRVLHKNNKGHSFNTEKTQLFSFMNPNCNKMVIDYLGYLIIAPKVEQIETNVPRPIQVKISDKKIAKIKSRVQKSFTSYSRDGNLGYLYKRIKFLTGNQYVIGDINRTKLKSGIYYNYPLINDKSQIVSLDIFYQRIFTSNHIPVKKAIEKLEKTDKTNSTNFMGKLKNLSFKFGYDNKVINTFTFKENKKIKACW